MEPDQEVVTERWLRAGRVWVEGMSLAPDGCIVTEVGLHGPAQTDEIVTHGGATRRIRGAGEQEACIPYWEDRRNEVLLLHASEGLAGCYIIYSPEVGPDGKPYAWSAVFLDDSRRDSNGYLKEIRTRSPHRILCVLEVLRWFRGEVQG